MPTSKDKDYKPQIVICDDKGLKKKQVAHTVVHELVHAYDFCRSKIEVSSCIQRACMEIRASSLSEECNLSSELMRGMCNLMMRLCTYCYLTLHSPYPKQFVLYCR